MNPDIVYVFSSLMQVTRIRMVIPILGRVLSDEGREGLKGESHHVILLPTSL
jgi:hypothetical protein